MGAAPGGPYTVEYSEELNIGYRWFDAKGIAPLFPFGHGLSYTTFAMSDLRVTPRAVNGTRPIAVELTVRNTGRRRGAEVPQVYLSLPASAGEPPKRLVGFEKVWLDPGEQRQVRIVIDPRAANHPLGVWDAGKQRWAVPAGEYRVQVGRSAGEIVAAETVKVIR
jgi:beta-glucosidase